MDKLSWNDITVKQFLQLRNIDMTAPDNWVEVAIIVLGENILDKPASQLGEILKQLKFMTKPLKESIPPKSFTVNGKKYEIQNLVKSITTGQYIDFVNYVKSNDYVQMLSVFIIPSGHKYNDGYDMSEVIKDIEQMPFPIANNIAFFFKKQWETYTEIFLSCLEKQMKKEKMPKAEMEKKLTETKIGMNLVSFPTCYCFVK